MTLTSRDVIRERPGWDEYFRGIARAVARRGDCRRDQVGAVIVNWENRIVSTGYNGVAPGMRGCLDGECPRGMKTYDQVVRGADYGDCIATHAEANAIEFLDSGEGLRWPEGMRMYVSREPCIGCRELIMYFGLEYVV